MEFLIFSVHIIAQLGGTNAEMEQSIDRFLFEQLQKFAIFFIFPLWYSLNV